MKKNIYSFTVLFIIIIFIITIFTKSEILIKTTYFSLNIFIKNIIPSLFPMFVISKILVEIDIPIYLGNIFNKIFTKLFKTKKEASFIFFMSMITGFPSSAKFIEDLQNKNLLTKKDSEKILTFTFFSNPLFIINTVGISFFRSETIGYIVLLSHITGNILTGIIFRNYNKQTNKNNINQKSQVKEKIYNSNLFEILITSIKESIETLINIFGIITFTLITLNLFIKNTETIPNIFIIGITEMTSGLKILSTSNINYLIKLSLSAFFISFGGLSIHMQIFSILTKRKIKYLPFLISRIIHGIITSIITIIIYTII